MLDQVDHGPLTTSSGDRVPAGHVFLMGDNRDDSLDSRFPAYEGGIGMVPVENLIGRALRHFLVDRRKRVLLRSPGPGSRALRADRIGNGYSGEPK